MAQRFPKKTPVPIHSHVDLEKHAKVCIEAITTEERWLRNCMDNIARTVVHLETIETEFTQKLQTQQHYLATLTSLLEDLTGITCREKVGVPSENLLVCTSSGEKQLEQMIDFWKATREKPKMDLLRMETMLSQILDQLTPSISDGIYPELDKAEKENTISEGNKSITQTTSRIFRERTNLVKELGPSGFERQSGPDEVALHLVDIAHSAQDDAEHEMKKTIQMRKSLIHQRIIQLLFQAFSLWKIKTEYRRNVETLKRNFEMDKKKQMRQIRTTYAQQTKQLLKHKIADQTEEISSFMSSHFRTQLDHQACCIAFLRWRLSTEKKLKQDREPQDDGQ